MVHSAMLNLRCLRQLQQDHVFHVMCAQHCTAPTSRRKEPSSRLSSPLFFVYEVSLVHITLHPLLVRMVFFLFAWLWVIISLPFAPSLKHSSLGWPACWLILKVPDSQRACRKKIHVVNTSCCKQLFTHRICLLLLSTAPISSFNSHWLTL